VFLLLLTANVVPSSPSLVTLMMEAIRYSETSVLTRATHRNIPQDSILKSKSISVTGNWVLHGYRLVRIKCCLDSQLTDGGEVVSLTYQEATSYSLQFEAQSTPGT
jgi:hypothetical protein